ncbi:MAG: ORF6N domain-containing protein [Pseudomonadota bacterium]
MQNIAQPALSVTIGDTKINRIDYEGTPVVTLDMIDKAHQRPAGTARKRFFDHSERFIIHEDFFHLSYHEVKSLSVFRTAGILPNSQGLIVLTENGYLMLIKSFNDDRAWEAQRVLVNDYFQTDVQPQFINQVTKKKSLLHAQTISKQLGISVKMVNVKLIEMGLQTKQYDHSDNLFYAPTEVGMIYATKQIEVSQNCYGNDRELIQNYLQGKLEL